VLDGAPVGVDALHQTVVPVGHRRDLRKVGDHDDLPLAGEGAQLVGDRGAGDPADAGVDLVEDPGGLGLGACRHAVQRQKHP